MVQTAQGVASNFFVDFFVFFERDVDENVEMLVTVDHDDC